MSDYFYSPSRDGHLQTSRTGVSADIQAYSGLITWLGVSSQFERCHMFRRHAAPGHRGLEFPIPLHFKTLRVCFKRVF